MDARSDNIIQVAIAMAERDGYDAVRMRDLAAQAGASLATVYRRFHRKEDILAAALEQHMTLLSASLQASPIPGASPAERLGNFFTLATRRMAERPRLAAAMLRTVASGVPELAERVTRYHGRMTEEAPTQSERDVVQLLQGVWLAALVGWTGGLYGHEQVIEQTNTAIRLLLAGQEPT
jgi:AcrR family transcriptional regulator